MSELRSRYPIRLAAKKLYKRRGGEGEGSAGSGKRRGSVIGRSNVRSSVYSIVFDIMYDNLFHYIAMH